MLSACFNAHAFKENDDSVGCTRKECFFADYEVSHIYRVEAVNVLVRADCHNDLVFVDVFRQRQLYKNSVNAVVLIQSVD